MSKRLQVLLPESELRAIQRLARANHLTVAEWVRQVLREAREGKSEKDATRKHRAIEAAVRHDSAPAPDIQQMLEEIEQGYHV